MHGPHSSQQAGGPLSTRAPKWRLYRLLPLLLGFLGVAARLRSDSLEIISHRTNRLDSASSILPLHLDLFDIDISHFLQRAIALSQLDTIDPAFAPRAIHLPSAAFRGPFYVRPLQPHPSRSLRLELCQRRYLCTISAALALEKIDYAIFAINQSCLDIHL